MKKIKFFIVDDDITFIKLMIKFLKSENFIVSYTTSSTEAFSKIIEEEPDCVIMDMMMPEIDGLELCKRLREIPSLFKTKIIFVTAKTYEFDKKRAISFGADAYIVKPVDPKTIVEQILYVIEDKVELRYWGIKGTLPIPGKNTVRYGGNTPCVSIQFPRGNFFIFDAGTGIKSLSDYLMSNKRMCQLDAKIFISHPHWDHINALQFFVPLFINGNEFEICGPSQGDLSMREIISGQMSGVYYPIKIKDFAARVYFRDLKEQMFQIDDIIIRTMLLNHPGYCLGYRMEYKGKLICYITDNELFPATSPYYNEIYLNKLINFVRDADVLITDCTYSDAQYPAKITWGHSSVGQVVDFAHRANVKILHLFHHDIDDNDDSIDSKLETARNLLEKMKSNTICDAPAERSCYKI
ncbi:MAG: response regulator [Desulfobacterales bacterium]|nr:response regulator [Desulfobacterales bacterium]